MTKPFLTPTAPSAPTPARRSRAPRVRGLAAAGLVAVLVAAGCSTSTNEGSPLGDAGSKSPVTGGKAAPGASIPATDTGGKLLPFTKGDFYAPPTPLPKGRHGTLIRYQPIDSASFGASTTYRVMYLSRSVPGKAVAVTGTVVVPTAKATGDGRKMVTLSHGTSGIADECAPSKKPDGELALLAPLVAKGFLLVETDYEGLGTPGRHPYLVGESEGRSVLDAALAAGSLPDAHAGKRVAIAGYSQGGHGALWADQLARTWTPDLDVVGTFAGAPASEIGVILQVAPKLPITGFAFMIVAGIAAAYPDADPATFLTPAGVAKLGLVDKGCVGQVIGAFGGTKPAELIRPDGPASKPWAEIAKENDAGQTKTDDPTLIIHSQADDLVPISFSDILQKRMCANGQVVERRILTDGQGHSAAAVPAYQQAIPWIEARFDAGGPKATSTCPGTK
ncbi:MAG: lipase family protein [Acidimicrobiales bacterium]